MTQITNQDVLDNLDLSSDILAEIAKNTSNAVIVTGLDGRILYVNEGFERITEYSTREVLGLKPGKLLQGPETDPDTVKRIRAGIKQLKRVNETILNYSKTNRKYWLQLDIFPIFDQNGEPVYFMAIESDVTALMEKERLAREQNERIRENISYAQLLQNALFRDQDQLSNLFDEHFVFDRPKDRVGGDFYLAEKIQGKKVVLLGDCTGHGVSGAIMTALSISTVKEHLDLYKTLDPEMILTKSLKKLEEMLSGGSNLISDSFEATLLFIDDVKKTIRYASTNQSLYIVGEKTGKLIKKKRGSLKNQDNPVLIKGTIDYHPGSMVYLSSDGFQDQFGGPESRKFGAAAMMEMFEAMHQHPCPEQAQTIEKQLLSWKQEEDQTDDILVLGIRTN